MKAKRCKKKGFSYTCTVEEIRAYQKLSAEDKLNWLEAANRFTAKAVTGKRKIIWEMFRQGKI